MEEKDLIKVIENKTSLNYDKKSKSFKKGKENVISFNQFKSIAAEVINDRDEYWKVKIPDEFKRLRVNEKVKKEIDKTAKKTKEINEVELRNGRERIITTYRG